MRRDRGPATDMALDGGGSSDRRILALDGLRGLMTIMVILSHYFGELAHGVRAMMFGWIAVNMFFVLSGFLIGKLILEKRDHANFFAVFYVRRACRIVPSYVITVLALALIISQVGAAWVDADVRFPLWSYLTFVQGFFMVSSGSIGAHWLAPTWTLAVEEHFYLVAPAAIVFTPRRWLVPVLIAAGLAAVVLRIAIYYFGFSSEMAALALFPGRADILVCGLLAAIALKNDQLVGPRYDLVLRVFPIVALLGACGLKALSAPLFGVCTPLLVALGCASFLLAIVRGAPEAARFRSRTLRFFGDNGYGLYLTHLPVLGLAHGLVLGARPDLASGPQWLITFAALPVAVLAGWGLTKLVEEPLTAYGRRWRVLGRDRPERD
ncbi:MAG: acyltransferase [Phenylobacterium sp.]|nr:acyltransferase [Phenylobacterium sp.]